ncbi:uncharacterized protein sS8_3513 [Methylocaldum marinum]|uniref:ScyD/ScyE family protein n=1 Tax=Methylocaldum marinum TaxID=1432792 RepID=A0A250KUX6_9GAMM|nr:ScyD/ScyE family protein [Methylocaldum marinum]BBA35450.1 uncharacterized protein sS8_3513 [Methylocaldum marinum]
MKNQMNRVMRSNIQVWALVLSIVLLAPNGNFAFAGPRGGVHQAPEPASDGPFTVIAGGLSNPRDILLKNDKARTIYVLEAGVGGAGPCVPSFNGDFDDCYGATASIARIVNGKLDRPITGLPSLAGPNGDSAIGPSHAVLHGNSLFVSFGNAGDSERRAVISQADWRFGQILRIPLVPRAPSHAVADLSAFEDKRNPDGEEGLETNPSGLAFGPAHSLYAVDAAGNSVLRVRPNRRVSLRYVFPTRDFPAPPFLGLPPGSTLPVQSVPTVIIEGPDRAHYVAEFTGFPYPKGAARVFRFGRTGEPTVYADGFTNIIDIAFGPDGSLYVLEMATNGLASQDTTGAVIRVAPDGTRTILASQGLVHPTAIAVDRYGEVYVINHGISAHEAELIRL